MSILRVASRRRTAALAAGAATIATLSGTAVLPGAQAASATVTSVGLSSYMETTTKTSTGRKVVVTFDISKSPDSSTSYLSLAVATPSGSERHSWFIPVPASSLSLDSNGKGSLTIGSKKLGDFGSIDLKVTPLKPATYTTCQKTRVAKNRKVSVDGVLDFNTGTKWGHVGSHSFHFADPSYVNWQYQTTAHCSSGSITPPCAAGKGFGAHHTDTTTYDSTNLYSYSYNGKYYLSGSRSVSLSAPVGASRTDIGQRTMQAPSLSVKPDGSAVMKVVAGKGSAKLTGPVASDPYTQKCGHQGKHMKSTSWDSSYTNGAHKLAVHMTAVKSLTIDNITAGGTGFDGATIERTQVVS